LPYHQYTDLIHRYSVGKYREVQLLHTVMLYLIELISVCGRQCRQSTRRIRSNGISHGRHNTASDLSCSLACFRIHAVVISLFVQVNRWH